MPRSVHDSKDHYSVWLDRVEDSIREAMNQSTPHRMMYSLEYFRLTGDKQQRFINGTEELRAET